MLKISSLFEAYITNLGKYNEGRLVGETLKFPATTEEVQALLKRIGVDGVRYEEIFITSFDGDVLGLYDHLGEYESIDELNHLAHVLSDLDQSDIEKFEAVIDSGEYTGSVHDLINLAQNLGCYDFYPGIDSEEALGRAYIEEMEMLDVPDNVLPYKDFQIVYAVHGNTDNTHVHLVMNQISFTDGQRYQGKKKDFYDFLQQLRDVTHRPVMYVK